MRSNCFQLGDKVERKCLYKKFRDHVSENIFFFLLEKISLLSKKIENLADSFLLEFMTKSVVFIVSRKKDEFIEINKQYEIKNLWRRNQHKLQWKLKTTRKFNLVECEPQKFVIDDHRKSCMCFAQITRTEDWKVAKSSSKWKLNKIDKILFHLSRHNCHLKYRVSSNFYCCWVILNIQLSQKYPIYYLSSLSKVNFASRSHQWNMRINFSKSQIRQCPPHHKKVMWNWKSILCHFFSARLFSDFFFICLDNWLDCHIWCEKFSVSLIDFECCYVILKLIAVKFTSIFPLWIELSEINENFKISQLPLIE